MKQINISDADYEQLMTLAKLSKQSTDDVFNNVVHDTLKYAIPVRLHELFTKQSFDIDDDALTNAIVTKIMKTSNKSHDDAYTDSCTITDIYDDYNSAKSQINDDDLRRAMLIEIECREQL